MVPVAKRKALDSGRGDSIVANYRYSSRYLDMYVVHTNGYST